MADLIITHLIGDKINCIWQIIFFDIFAQMFSKLPCIKCARYEMAFYAAYTTAIASEIDVVIVFVRL